MSAIEFDIDMEACGDIDKVILHDEMGCRRDIECVPVRTCVNKAVEINKMAPLGFRTDNLICSACGETTISDSEGVNFPIDWDYCPHCGAKVVG